MKNFGLIKKLLNKFVRKIKQNQKSQNIAVQQKQKVIIEQEDNIKLTQQKISKLLELGYTESEVVRIIKDKRFQMPQQNDQQNNQNINIESLPEKIQNELKNYEQMNKHIDQYKQSDNYLLKKDIKSDQVLYDELLDQIAEGVSIIDNESFQKSQDLVQTKSFNRKDLIKIEKQRQLKLEQRAEIELVKQKILDEKDQEYNFADDQEQDFQEDEVEPMDNIDFEFQNDWVKQIEDPNLTLKEKAAMENAYIDKFNITRKEAKQIMKQEFFQRKKVDEKIKIREQSDKQRKRYKMMQKLYDTMQKRSLEKFDYQNDEGYKKEKELNHGQIHQNSNNFNEGMKQLFERINSKKKEVLYDKWEIAKKRYSNNVKVIVEDAILESKFQILKNSLNYAIQVEDIIISNNAHFVYILWDFLESQLNLEEDINKIKEKISLNLNHENYELESKLFHELNLRKKPYIVFIHSDKNQQIQLYKKEYIQQEISNQLEQMKLKNAQKFNNLIANRNYYFKYIDELTKQIDTQIGNQFDDLFIAESGMKYKEKQIKQQKQKEKNQKKDKKNRHIHTSQKKQKQNKALKFWNKISTNQISNILIPGTNFVILKHILFPLGDISQLPKYPQ